MEPIGSVSDLDISLNPIGNCEDDIETSVSGKLKHWCGWCPKSFTVDGACFDKSILKALNFEVPVIACKDCHSV